MLAGWRRLNVNKGPNSNQKYLEKQSFSSILLEIWDLTGEKTDFPPVPAKSCTFSELQEAKGG